MAWELDGRAETLAELLSLWLVKRQVLARDEANALLEDEGGVCNAETVVGLGRLLGRKRYAKVVNAYSRKVWLSLVATCPAERWVDDDIMLPLNQTSRTWVLNSSFWIGKHTRRLACYWALRLDGPPDLWELCYKELWKRHACGIVNERTCGCYKAGLATYGLAKGVLIV